MATTDLTELAATRRRGDPEAAPPARPHPHPLRHPADHPDRGGVPVHRAVLLDARQRGEVDAGADANSRRPCFPPQWVWQNFVDAVNYIPFGLYALNSTIITVGITIGSVLSNTVVAYGFSRIQWPGRNALFYVCIATLFLPYPVILVALFDIFGKLPSFGLQGAHSWVDTFLPLIVPAFFANPFYIFLMRQFMLGIPKELSDAARVDGASEIRTFWNVILPLTEAGRRGRRDLRRCRRLERIPPAAALPAGQLEVPAGGRPRLLHERARRRLQPPDGRVGARRPPGRGRSSSLGQRYFVEGITVGGVKG